MPRANINLLRESLEYHYSVPDITRKSRVHRAHVRWLRPATVIFATFPQSTIITSDHPYTNSIDSCSKSKSRLKSPNLEQIVPTSIQNLSTPPLHCSNHHRFCNSSEGLVNPSSTVTQNMVELDQLIIPKWLNKTKPKLLHLLSVTYASSPDLKWHG